MLKKLQFFALTVMLSVPLASCVIYRVSDLVLPEPTATPVPKLKPVLPLEAQAGDTNFIIVIGILIFLFITIPILLRYKDWRAS
jgi:hypothetical protein